MMDNVATLVSTLGFPIVAYLLIFWFVQKTLDDFRKTVENNTLAITRLLERLDKDDAKDETSE